MIGKMYRPLKILNIPDKRGFEVLNKYKSNFGGIFKFKTQIFLNYNADEETETLHLNFVDLNVPLLVEEVLKTGDREVLTSRETRSIKNLRKLQRPTKITSKEALSFSIIIESPKNENETDVFNIEMIPIVIDNEEYIKLSVDSKTPIAIQSELNIKIGG